MAVCHSQVVEFAHHVDVDCVDYVKMCWRLAKPVVVLGADGTETQLIMYFHADTQIAPCYVFVHEDGIPDAVAQSIGQRYWLGTCQVMREQLATFRGRLDAHYSPSKPASKIARFAAAAASMFSPSP